MAEEKTQEEVEEFDFEEWLDKGMRGLRRKMRHKIVPEGFKTHMRAARKEMLLAWRSLLDDAIARLEEEPQRTKKATK
jgi:hypothetical protein